MLCATPINVDQGQGNGRGSAMTTEPAGHGVRRMCIAFDLERYSGGTDAAQVEKQRAMARLVQEACERGTLERAHWLKQEQGDGELALLTPGIDEARVITALWREFREGLHRYNRHANAAAQLRMRIAVHEGMTYIADNGFAGNAVNTVCRLRDCAEAKNALSGTDSDAILIVSDRIYHDVIRGFDALDLPSTAFTETAIDLPDKGFHATAYIYSGGGPRPGSPPDDAAAQETPGPQAGPAPSGPALNFGPNARVEMRDVVSGTVNHVHGIGK
jgi:hypothetical protein